MFKDHYLYLCSLYSEQPNQRLLKNIRISSQKLLIMEQANICDRQMKVILATIEALLSGINGISFSHNQFLKDYSLKLLVEFFEKHRGIQYLLLEKINVTDSAMLRFIEMLPFLDNLQVLNLA